MSSPSHQTTVEDARAELARLRAKVERMIAERDPPQEANAGARQQAEEDAALYGAGFLLVRQDGSMQRIDPFRVIARPEKTPHA